VFRAASVSELPGIYSDSARRGHAQSTFDIGHVTQHDRTISRARCSAGITAGGQVTADVLPTVSSDANSSGVSFFALEVMP
jgi:hypothetical protein